MTEVEAVLNSRPLTYISTDPLDPQALTPNNFLNYTAKQAGAFHAGGTRGQIRKQWRQALPLADYFWSRWLKEYLPSLRTWTQPHAADQ